jgi:hypothetical protein
MTRQICVYVEDWQFEKLQKEGNKSEVARKAFDLYYKKEEKEMTKFETMWDYVKEADISNYKKDYYFESNPDAVIGQVDVSEDPDLYLGGYDNTIEVDGKLYKSINWGEDEESYILQSELNKRNWGEFWTVYIQSSKDEHEYHSIGLLFQTREAAASFAEDREYDFELEG